MGAKGNGNQRLVRLKRGTGTKSIVFIHDGCGEAIQYLEFCKSISSQYSVYGIRYEINNMDYKPKVHNITEMASEYLHILRTAGVESIYAIVGYCIGGKIAYEMCQQFPKEIPYLFLLNAIPPNQTREKNDFTFKDEYKFLRKQCPLFFPSKKEESVNSLWQQFKLFLEKHQLVFKITKMMLPEYIKNIMAKFNCADNPEKVVKYINLVRGFEETHYRYTSSYHNKLKTKTVYFNALNEEVLNYKQWDNFIVDIEFIDVNSGHIGLISQENVRYMVDARLGEFWSDLDISA